MKQEYKKGIVSKSEGITTTDFTINTDPSMFQILTTKVYNNPHLAVIREWSTNACDACIEHGMPVKFDVHLPNREEPYFSVRDYGPGLSNKDMTTLFTTLGASTKRDSDNLNGTLGIGRMAGLAVSDSFIVHSIHQNYKTIYAVALKDGIPTINKMGSFPSEEPTGLLLQVAVEESKFNNYRVKAEQVYKYFDHKPELNDPTVVLQTPTPIVETDKYIMDERANYNKVLMCQVLYDIPSNISDDFAMEYQGVIFKAQPGEVTFNPGRESLNLDTKTLEYFKKVHNDLENTFINDFYESLLNLPNDMDRLNTIKKWLYGGRMKYSGKRGSSLFSKSLFSKDLESAMYTGNLDDITIQIKTSNSKDIYPYPLYNNPSIENTFIAFTNSTHIVEDIQKGYITNLKQSERYTKCIIWKGNPEKAKSILNNSGIPYKLASSYCKKKETTYSKDKFYVSSHNGNGCFSKRHEIDLEIHPKDKITLYTVFLRDKTLKDRQEFIAHTEIIDIIQDTQDTHFIIKGMTKNHEKKILNNPNWIPIDTFIKDYVAKNPVFLIPDQRCETGKYKHQKHIINYLKNLNFPDPDILQQVIENYKKYEEEIENPSGCIVYSDVKKEAVKNLGGKLTPIKYDDSILKLFISKYPISYSLIEELAQSSYRHNIKKMIEEVAKMEKINENNDNVR